MVLVLALEFRGLTFARVCKDEKVIGCLNHFCPAISAVAFWHVSWHLGALVPSIGCRVLTRQFPMFSLARISDLKEAKS